MDHATNNSVLGIAPLAKTLPAAGIALVMLFVLMKPEASFGLSFLERLLFWSAHVGLGLGGIALISRLARPRWLNRLPLLVVLLLLGVAGALLLAPAYLALEALFPAATPEVADDWLDRFAGRGLGAAVLVEFLEVIPVFVAAWFAVNLPLLLARETLSGNGPGTPEGPGGGHTQTTREPRDELARAAFLGQLPRAIGEDIVAISSDMHYLHVYTTLGKCMILGALRDAADALADAGMLVHRSHWVAHEHVTRLGRKDTHWYCEMSNGARIPVSRRNRKAVANWYGRADNVVTLSARQSP
ncbi:MAG: LytTR family DNA-binding domain-containing protein [Woeseiaceae bacterium]|jgi:hypothetical protein|nr:LytTR family DNA-binding domain-containing protein [Woeseiaceae bacterium]